jgi:LPPG:FO 2-phospho-L-lactate transferase
MSVLFDLLVAPFADFGFMQRALFGSLMLSLGACPVGVFLMLRRMSLAGDAMSHANLPGAAAGFLIFGLDILPMTDDPVATWVESDDGPMEFQRYFVEHRCAPVVRDIIFRGAEQACPAPGTLEAIREADVIMIAPSNPFLSVDPILAVPDIREALEAADAPVVAVSPLVRGTAVKGPTAKLMAELGHDISNAVVLARYRPFIDAMLIHEGDDIPDGPELIVEDDILMKDIDGRVRVARAALALANCAATR